MTEALPTDFDGAAYLELHPDLRAARVDPEVHYLRHGRGEGRPYLPHHPPRDRQNFLHRLRRYQRILEIGPFDHPVAADYSLPEAVIEYADWQPTDELKRRAASTPGRNPDGVPEITYVTTDGRLGSLTGPQFDCVVSSHMIEHVPDLITHLVEVRAALKPGGTYLMVVPDERRCFDHFLPESALPEVLTAYVERRTRPSLRSIIEHRVFTRQDFDHTPDPLEVTTKETWAAVQRAAGEAGANPYVDVHCWQFTPDSLPKLVLAIAGMGLLEQPSVLHSFSMGSEFGVEITWPQL